MRFCSSCLRVYREAEDFCPSDGSDLEAVTPTHDPLVGMVLDGRYRLRSLLGTGGMGFVYDAEQIGLDRRVAVKMLFAERTRDRAAVARFRREALAMAALDHPGIVRVLDYGDGDGGRTPYIVMERVRGRPLDAFLGRGRLPVGAALDIAAQLADALSVAHAQGIVHRDLKPENVHLEVQRGRVLTRVLDFGLALLANPLQGGPRLTRKGVLFGTPEYMSPEQIRGYDATATSDLYSLGIVLYELLSGAVPFATPDAASTLALHLAEEPKPLVLGDTVSPEIAAEIGRVVLGLLAKEPRERPADAQAVARSLFGLLERIGPAPTPSQYPGLLSGAAEPSTLPSTAARPTEHDTSEMPARRESSSQTDVPPWLEFTTSRDADRALEAALSGADRTRRLRSFASFVGVIFVVGVGALVYRVVSPGDATARVLGPLHARGSHTPLVIDSRPAPVGPSSDGVVPAAGTTSGVVDVRMPGGDAQSAYERARRALDDALAERGLRTRDVRSHPAIRAMWRAQEAAARAGDFASASEQLTVVGSKAAELSTEALLDDRLRALRQRAETGGCARRSSALRAALAGLAADAPQAGVDRAATRRFVRRFDEVEELCTGSP